MTAGTRRTLLKGLMSGAVAGPALASVAPNPVDRIVMDRAVKAARRTRAATAAAVDSTDARTSTPTPALPPIPCTRPTPNAPSGVRCREPSNC